jgi:hypothetical protein
MTRCTEALRLQALAADAAQFLAAQAQQHVRLERELAQLQVLVTDGSQAPAEQVLYGAPAPGRFLHF